MLIEEKVVLLCCKIEEYLLFLNLFCPDASRREENTDEGGQYVFFARLKVRT